MPPFGPLLLVAALLLAFGLGGCGAAMTDASASPTVGQPSFATQLVAAIEAEAVDAQAVAPYLELVDRAIAEPEDPQATAALVASLHALLGRELPDLGSEVAHAAAFRSRSGLLETSRRLRAAWGGATGHATRMRPLLAAALHQLALRVGDIDAAVLWRGRSGCAPAAAVLGPVAWPALLGLETPSPLPPHGPLPASLPGVEPFAATVKPVAVPADGCAIDVNAMSTLRGVRLVVVDVLNPRAQAVTVALSSSSAAIVELGGTRLLERRLSAGAEPSTMLARVELEAGRARLVARVAQNMDSQSVAVALWDDAGAPVATAVPVPGEPAPARAHDAASLDPWLTGTGATPTDDAAARALSAAALQGLGRAREAGALLSSDRSQGADGRSASPRTTVAASLLRLRAAALARDMPRSEGLTELQAAADSVLGSCPRCWEARIARAAVLAERAGQAEGVFAGLTAMDVHPTRRATLAKLTAPELAFVALRAHRSDLSDVERASYDTLARLAPGSALLADLDARLHARHGAELVRAACEGGTSRAGARCLQARLARGDHPAVRSELGRLRALRGSPLAYQEVELASLLAEERLPEALALLERMLPAARSLAVLGAVVGWPDGDAPLREQARRVLGRDRPAARDAPFVLEPLSRLLGVVDDPTAELERVGRELCARDRAEAFLPGAGTAVLRHLETYDLDSNGLLHYRLYDLRRVSGTTDVAEGASGAGPSVDGRSVFRTLRQRIHKRDGRVLDPDPEATGAQGHTELSQLETGDYVEVVAEGWALPDDSGQLVVDTPDLLPLRTSVREAEIRFSRPAELPLELWAHARLGQGESRTSKTTGGGTRSETRWRLRDVPPRRVEEGVAPLEARVAISFGTDSWQRIARSLGERQRALDEQDPYVGEWLRATLAGEPLPVDKQIARVVAAVGRDVHEADADALSDFVSTLGSGPQRETARTILQQSRGSRSWVVHRALRELGIPSRIAVSEIEPFSAAPGFPPRSGRFRHPLVLVDLPAGPLWIDADVSGPPLPPGQVSPELRGRQALLPSGELLRVEGTMDFEPDEIDLRLRVEPNGDAHGTFTALLHGRAAQQLAEDFRVTVGSERDRLLRNVVLGWFPWADVTDMSLSSEEGSWQLAVRASVAFAGFARPEGRDGLRWSLPGVEAVHTVYPQAATSTLSARHASQSARSSDLRVDDPLLFHLHRRIELPEGCEVTQLPQALAVASPAVTAERQSTRDGRVIDEQFRLNLPAGMVAAADFDAFAALLERIDDGFAFGIGVRAPKP